MAIVGVGCRFPGARDPDAFWHVLRQGVDAIKEVPAERWDLAALYDPRPGTKGKICSRFGGFLTDIDRFDFAFFGISPREAARMDPQQRLLLEVAFEALEDAGLPLEALGGTRTGVFIGICSSEYGAMQFRSMELRQLDMYAGTGSSHNVAAGRLAYCFDLRGPSIPVDTGCSSSLVAVHLACQALWSGQASVALAGGVSLLLDPAISVLYSSAQMLAPDGRSKAFDARADGFVRGDGAGMVVLKPLSQARADRDRIYAVILGSAVNSDGRASGFLMTPAAETQEAVLRDAYRDAGVPPAAVRYVEAHGAGTRVGDPVELRAMGAVFGEGRSMQRPCLIGSVKTNIGHTEGAAGIAGLLKATLSLQRAVIPPSLHFEQPNPDVPWAELPLAVAGEAIPWPGGEERRIAGVSSFGISGINAHVVLEEAPRPADSEDAAVPSHLLVLSARSAQALKDRAADIQRLAAGDACPPLRDLCYTAGARRTHHGHRLALVARSREEVAEHLSAFLQGEARPLLASGYAPPGRELRSRIAFVFSGQGPRFWPLGREFLEGEPVFRSCLERCDELIGRHASWSLLRELTAPESESRMQEADVCQPAFFAVQLALAELWRSWGVEPAAVVGHSMGEVAAACVAGALTVEDALRVVLHRGRLIRTVAGKGRMASVELSLRETEEILTGWETHLSVAASNGPASTIVSGDPAALASLQGLLERKGVFCRTLEAVDFASHSPQMEPLRDDLIRALDGLRPRPPAVPMYSTVSGTAHPGLLTDGRYWARNLREPVLFSAAVDSLLSDGFDVFLEISPHPSLAAVIPQCLRHAGRDGTVLASLRRGSDEREALLRSLGELYTRGLPIAWSAVHHGPGRCVTLPSYPWQRQRCWFQEGASQRRPMGAHPLLGPSFQAARLPHVRFFDGELALDRIAYLGDHRVEGSAVLPGAAFVEMAAAAASEACGWQSPVVGPISFHRALFLPDEGSLATQLVLTPEGEGQASFEVYSRSEEAGAWTLHASGAIREAPAAEGRPPAGRLPRDPGAGSAAEIDPADYYRRLEEIGYGYGPSFRALRSLSRGESEALGEVRIPSHLESELGLYRLHPVLLDAALQVVGAALPAEAGARLHLPTGMAELRVHRALGPSLRVHARASLRAGGGVVADVDLFDEAEGPAAEVIGLELRPVEARRVADADRVDDWLYQLEWRPRPGARPGGASAARAGSGSWLVLEDRGGVARAFGNLLEQRGERCVYLAEGEPSSGQAFGAGADGTEDLRSILSAAGGPDGAWRGVLHFQSLNVPDDGAAAEGFLDAVQPACCDSVLGLVKALAAAGLAAPPPLWLVSRGAQSVDGEAPCVGRSPLWGLGRVIALEHPELRCRRVDLDPTGDPGDLALLLDELFAEEREDQVAFRKGVRHVLRMARHARRASPGSTRDGAGLPLPGSRPFRLATSRPGFLEALHLEPVERRPPEAGEVEIEVAAAAVNFMDVMNALGALPGGPMPLGGECAGRISRVGEAVEGLAPGDEVIALAPASFAAFATTDARLVAPVPAGLGPEEAATIPVPFLTSYYALHHLARLQAGERVLIHAAASGVGLAAVQLALRAGAEIFATAGSPEKLALLESLGVRHVFSDRSLDFAEQVRERTQGCGVDVVLNSLAGPYLARSLSTLAPFGRFLELGKVDIQRDSPIGLSAFRNSISFFAIDLARISRDRIPLFQSLFQEVLRLFDAGELQPLPATIFPIQSAPSALRHVAQRKHVGRVLISVRDVEAPAAAAVAGGEIVRPDGTYLVTGGVGALGLQVAEWMVERGARHLVLVSRRGPGDAAERTLERLRAKGADVRFERADVADRAQLVRVLAGIRAGAPPLRGVVHAAGILDDGILLQLDRERFAAVLAPKVAGAWNLHTLTLEEPLDLFVLFSSTASALGSPGQGSYAAANAFLDALAELRRAEGRSALSVNWGPWADEGLAAAAEREGRLALGGVATPIPARSGLEILEGLLQDGVRKALAVPIDWHEVRRRIASGRELPVLEDILAGLGGEGSAAPSTNEIHRGSILAANPSARRELVESYLREQVARVLGLSGAAVDVQLPLNHLGFDSLMAVTLKNEIEANLGVSASMMELLQGPSVSDLSARILEQMLPGAVRRGEAADQEEAWEEFEL